MSDSESDTIVVQPGDSLESMRLVHDEGEEEESSDGEDTPPDEEVEVMVEGMEREAKQLFLGKENVDGEEHEWVDRVSNKGRGRVEVLGPKLTRDRSDAHGYEHASIGHNRQGKGKL